MLHKYGKFYADWKDHHGQRRRKAFATKRQATTHQNAMRQQTARKKARASAQ